MDAHRDKGLLEEHQEMAYSSCDSAFDTDDRDNKERDVDGCI
jgi:hypothetical protein